MAWPTWPAPQSTIDMSGGNTVCVKPLASSATPAAAASPMVASTGIAASAETKRRRLRRWRMASSARAIQSASRASRRSSDRRTTPPQHWPNAGPSGMRTNWRRASPPTLGASIMACAISIARHSRWPPPMVPKKPSVPTSMSVPGSRGAEPCTSVTVTSTHGCPACTVASTSAKRNGRSCVWSMTVSVLQVRQTAGRCGWRPPP